MIGRSLLKIPHDDNSIPKKLYYREATLNKSATRKTALFDTWGGEPNKIRRTREVLWFNTPYNKLNMITNLGKNLFGLIRKHLMASVVWGNCNWSYWLKLLLQLPKQQIAYNIKQNTIRCAWVSAQMSWYDLFRSTELNDRETVIEGQMRRVPTKRPWVMKGYPSAEM